MSSNSSESPNETFMGDLPSNGQPSRASGVNGSGTQREGDATNKPKRIACVLCRRRKLRCDGARPTCGTCKRLAHDCAYDEVRKKSGPKRGYVKLLEARLHEVEKLLKSQDKPDPPRDTNKSAGATSFLDNSLSVIAQGISDGGVFMQPDQASASFPDSISPRPETFPAASSAGSNTANGDFPWEMIGLGLDEPLPTQDVINDLNNIYFTKIHPSVPVIHKPRFMAAMNLAPHMRPPVCLRYIMWTLAASVTEKYEGLQEHFYQRARKYAQSDEMRGYGETTITVAHCQAWVLMSTYEFKLMYFPRAWLSTGRAVRLAQMMQLHRLDGSGLDVKQCLGPPKDWTEREERRRTFWMAFCVDRYASIGTGWPMGIDEQDIMTNLPASEEAYEKSKPMHTGTLEQALSPSGVGSLTPFGGIVVTASFFGRNLLHLHRPGPDDNDSDLDGGFWTRHRKLDNILSNISLGLPDSLRLPGGLPDANTIFMNMCLHTSAICLHQAAIFKADKYRLPGTVSSESKVRCVTAAVEIASIMRMISHMDLCLMNPYISFCVYVAARVFVQYLKTRPKDQQMNASLQFLLQAMQALRKRNPLTESFLVQLDLDLENTGVLKLQKPLGNPKIPREIPVNTDSVHCSPVFEIRESQSGNAPVNRFGHGPSALPRNTSQYSPAPPPPYEASTSTLSTDAQQNFGFVPGQQDVSMELPQRQRSTRGMHLSPHNAQINDSEMDTSSDLTGDNPSPSTVNTQSRAGSTSHSSSFSPAHPPDEMRQHFLPSPESSSNMSQPNAMTPPVASAGGTDPNFFSTTGDEMFSPSFFNQSVGAAHNDPMGTGFMIPNDWDMTTGLSSGMSPLPEGSWNQMLENISMGWDSIGPPHQGDTVAPHNR